MSSNETDKESADSQRGWFVYLVRCADRSLYTGITTEPERRVAEHNGKKAARYTRSRQPVELVYLEPVKDRSSASRREAEIKRLTKREKEVLCKDSSINP